MTKEALFDIFGSHLLDNENLEDIFLELLGMTDAKPFECVGTVDEVRWSMKTIVEKYTQEERPLPYLATVFMDQVPMDRVQDLLEEGVEDNIPADYKKLLED